MPDPYRPLVAAVDRLTEQARRLADQGTPRTVLEGTVTRCTCGCPETTHTGPDGHCTEPFCRDEPCTSLAEYRRAQYAAEQPGPDVLRVLLDRVQRGLPLRPPEGRLLREHVEELHTRAEQADDLSRAAHRCSNDAERARAAAQQSAKAAEAAVARVRAECHAIGTDTCNAVTRILTALDGPSPV